MKPILPRANCDKQLLQYLGTCRKEMMNWCWRKQCYLRTCGSCIVHISLCGCPSFLCGCPSFWLMLSIRLFPVFITANNNTAVYNALHMWFLTRASKGTFLEEKMLDIFASYWWIFLHKIHVNFTLPCVIQGSEFSRCEFRWFQPHCAEEPPCRQHRWDGPRAKGLLLPSKALPLYFYYP